MHDPKEETLDQRATRIARSRSRTEDREPSGADVPEAEPAGDFVHVVTRHDAKGHGSPEVHADEERAWARFRQARADALANGDPAPSIASRAVLDGEGAGA